MQDELPPRTEENDALDSEPAPELTLGVGTRPAFSAAELSAAARVIEHQVKLATARFAPKPP